MVFDDGFRLASHSQIPTTPLWHGPLLFFLTHWLATTSLPGAAQWLQPEDFARLCHCSLSLVLRREQRRMWQYYCHLEVRGCVSVDFFFTFFETRNTAIGSICLDVDELLPLDIWGLVGKRWDSVDVLVLHRFIAMLMYNVPIFPTVAISNECCDIPAAGICAAYRRSRLGPFLDWSRGGALCRCALMEESGRPLCQKLRLDSIYHYYLR